MATIIIKNSTGSGIIPSSLQQGELAINTKDGKLFYGSGSSNIVKEFTGSGGGGSGSSPTFPFTGSALITGSLILTGSLNTTGSVFFISTNTNIVSTSSYVSNDFFLIRNATTSLSINSGVQITSSANNPIQVLGTNNNNLLQVSQSGLIIFSTSSTTPSGIAPNGGILFTSASLFVGLE
jgi:hypothetical protein